jgi:hypothetical protein
MVGPDIDLLDENFEPVGILELRDAFFAPEALGSVGGLAPVIRYFVASHQQETDLMVVDPLRNFLFGPPGAGGLDLASLNIQRGRDHGLADYNTLRRDFGLPRVTSFAQVTSDPALAAKLASLYSNVDNIDPWVGMLAEDRLPGASVGRTHMAVLMDQFRRLRDGDRFWYQNNQFSRADLSALEATRLSAIFARTTGVTGIQPNVFFARPQACRADFNHDGVANNDDLTAFLAAFQAGLPSADFDRNGTIDQADADAFMAALAAGC